LLQALNRNFFAVNALDEFVVKLAQTRIAAHVHAGFEHHVNRFVEIVAGFRQTIILEVERAFAEIIFRARDELRDARIFALDLVWVYREGWRSARPVRVEK
jgi:hypothetical protein